MSHDWWSDLNIRLCIGVCHLNFKVIAVRYLHYLEYLLKRCSEYFQIIVDTLLEHEEQLISVYFPNAEYQAKERLVPFYISYQAA